LQPQQDEALANWVLQCQARKIQLTGELICEKGRKLAKQIGLNPQDCNTPDFSVGATSYAIGDVDLTYIKAGESDIYKVDQLKAMQWCIRTWNSILPETITNCFHHTGLFDYEITTIIHEVHPNDEDSSVLAELKESLQIFINESNSSFITPSNPVRLDAIRTVISLLDTTISDHNTVLRTLHLLQQEIQLQVFSSKIQTTLDSFIQVEYQ
ncbi:13527_t:CDS:2, partial [Cetraspora pellucida]